MLTIQSTVEDVMLQQPERRWELHRGQLREKPDMTEPHNWVTLRLMRQIERQIDETRFECRPGIGRVSRGHETYYVPDVFIVPVRESPSIRHRGFGLEVFRDPLPFVAEIWSPSTGGYDVDEKLPEYQARGDLEIWRVHPYDYTITTWRRQADGTYVEAIHDHGALPLHVFADVEIDLDELFR